MKQALITGGGSKFGQKITQELVNAGYCVHLVTSNGARWADNPQVKVIPVNWQTLSISDIKFIIANLPKLDLLFFNHNASALTLENLHLKKYKIYLTGNTVILLLVNFRFILFIVWKII
jgi:NAD(P)-dependent dehydrogenase (short-subunit alcohol dehydrogenase family)